LRAVEGKARAGWAVGCQTPAGFLERAVYQGPVDFLVRGGLVVRIFQARNLVPAGCPTPSPGMA
jgi:hypothetical protein